MSYIVHAGVSFDTSSRRNKKPNLIFNPQVGFYFPVTVFKDRALCGSIVTLYHVESIFVDANYEVKHEDEMFAISCIPGHRPTYYTDLESIPRVLHKVDLVNIPVDCVMCENHRDYPLWQLDKMNL